MVILIDNHPITVTTCDRSGSPNMDSNQWESYGFTANHSVWSTSILSAHRVQVIRYRFLGCSKIWIYTHAGVWLWAAHTPTPRTGYVTKTVYFFFKHTIEGLVVISAGVYTQGVHIQHPWGTDFRKMVENGTFCQCLPHHRGYMLSIWFPKYRQ